MLGCDADTFRIGVRASDLHAGLTVNLQGFAASAAVIEQGPAGNGKVFLQQAKTYFLPQVFVIMETVGGGIDFVREVLRPASGGRSSAFFRIHRSTVEFTLGGFQLKTDLLGAARNFLNDGGDVYVGDSVAAEG